MNAFQKVSLPWDARTLDCLGQRPLGLFGLNQLTHLGELEWFFVVLTSLLTPGSFVILHPGEFLGIPCFARKSELITNFFYDS